MAESGRVGPADGHHHRRPRRRNPDDRRRLRSRSSPGCDRKKGGRRSLSRAITLRRNTKIHVVVDAKDFPIRLGLTAGQTCDGQIADTLLIHSGPRTIVLADKAYNAERIRKLIKEQAATPNPPKGNWRRKQSFSKRLYREHHPIVRSSPS